MVDALDRYRERHRGMGQPWLVPGVSKLGDFRIFNSAGQMTSSQPVLLTGSNPSGIFEKCWDQNHGKFATRKRDGSRLFRTGGPFTKLIVKVPGMEVKGIGTYSTKGNPGFSGNSRWEYVGGFTCPTLSHDGVALSDYQSGGSSVRADNALLPLITPTMENEAWNIRPKLERGSLANALYELKDMPGMLKQASREFHRFYRGMTHRRYKSDPRRMPKRVSDDFLAIQFGWAPFVSDVVTMCDAVIFSEQYIADITAMNNTWVKRKRVSQDVQSTRRLKRFYTQSVLPNGFTVVDLCKDFVLDGQICRGYCDVHADESLRVWYEGSFKFYRPEFDMTSDDYSSVVQTVNRHITLYGLSVSPTHIWKALPWSWLVDWFSNIGDLIERADEQYNDGMVAKYLYVMHHLVRSIRSIHYLNFWSGALTLQFDRLVETKLRHNASSPYGFVLGGDLSASQWSILAALGLSRNVKFAKSF